ncbi:MAG: cob(I)yrinic acid a,c-diamide adenosyltransferase [Promethearchaeota archaeon]
MRKPIYTKKGDKGETGLFSGEHIEKVDQRVEAYGTVDELNSSLGIAKVYASEFLKKYILRIQAKLFYLASELASKDPEKVIKSANLEDVKTLEEEMDYISSLMPPIESFVIPGGTQAAAFLHLSRTICRRAEREVIRLSKVENINLEVIRYLNRLSDYLFVLSRYANIIDGEGDQLISRDGISFQKKTKL